MIFDDNILKFMDCGKTLETGLEDLIKLGFAEMQKVNAKIWSGSDSPNPAHWSTDVDVGKGLVYPPQFLKVLKAAQLPKTANATQNWTDILLDYQQIEKAPALSTPSQGSASIEYFS